jgi:DNA-binding Lrp family transcriptional regulator
MSLDQKDIEIIERLLFKSSDDIATSIARSFERLEERIDASESRLYSRMAEVEDRVEASRQDLSDIIGEVKEEVREGMRLREMM